MSSSSCRGIKDSSSSFRYSDARAGPAGVHTSRQIRFRSRARTRGCLGGRYLHLSQKDTQEAVGGEIPPYKALEDAIRNNAYGTLAESRVRFSCGLRGSQCCNVRCSANRRRGDLLLQCIERSVPCVRAAHLLAHTEAVFSGFPGESAGWRESSAPALRPTERGLSA